MRAATGVPKGARAFVALFLVAFIVCGFAGIEAWPLTGWRLFSALRHEVARGWEVDVVDSEGREQPLPFARLSAAYRGFVHVAGDLSRLSARERIQVCDAWIAAARSLGLDVQGLRIYRTERHLSRPPGGGPVPGTRAPAHECGAR